MARGAGLQESVLLKVASGVGSLSAIAVGCISASCLAQQAGPSWTFLNGRLPTPHCSAYYGSSLTGGTEPWIFGYIKTHPPSAPQALDLTVVTLQHRTIRLSRLQSDELIKAWLDETPVRLQFFSYSDTRPDPFSTGYATFTIVDQLQWSRLLLSSQSLKVEVPGVEIVTVPIGRGSTELRKVDACDLRPKRGE